MMHTLTPAFPAKKYNVIYVDSPWSYNDKMSGHSFSLDHEYETQNLEWIQTLPLKDIAEKDCACFSWVVSPMLDEGIETLKKWGFKYKTIAFVWNKTYKGSLTKDVKNLGRWTMGNVELCLLGTRGVPKRVTKNVQQLVTECRGRHSEKPHEVRQRIVRLMGDVPRIELFARKRYRGWDAWGNEVEEGYADPPPLWED